MKTSEEGSSKKRKRGLYTAIIAFMATVVFIVSAGGYLIYKSERKRAQKDEYTALSAITKLKSNQLIQWKKERLSEARFFTRITPNDIYTIEILKGNKVAYSRLQHSLRQIMTEGRYENIFIIDSTGKELFKVYNLPTGTFNSEFSTYVKRVYNKGQIVIRDFYYCTIHKKVHLEILAPVKDESDIVKAVMVFQIEPSDYIMPLIQEWPTPRKSAETVIVRKDDRNGVKMVEYMSGLKYRDKKDTIYSVSTDNPELVSAKAISGYEGIIEGYDYRGVKVLADINKVPDTPWYLISKIDTDEVYKELTKKAVLIFTVAILLILLVGSTIAWAYNYRERLTYKELVDKKRELNVSRNIFKTALLSIDEGIILTNNYGIIEQINPVAVGITGYSEEECTGQLVNDILKLIDDNEDHFLDDFVNRFLPGRPNTHFMISRKGVKVPVWYSERIITDKYGEATGKMFVVRDETNNYMRWKIMKIRIELISFSKNHTLSETLTLVTDFICSYTDSPMGFFHIVSPDEKGFSELSWSTNSSEFIKLLKDVSNEDPSIIPGVWTKCLQRRRPIIRTPDSENNICPSGVQETAPEFITDGEEIYGEGSLASIKIFNEIAVPIMRNGRIVAVMGLANRKQNFEIADVKTLSYLGEVTWDITENRIMEDRISEREERIRLLFDSTAEGIIGTDRNGLCIFCNKAAIDMLGYDKESDLLGMSLNSLVAERVGGRGGSINRDIFSISHDRADAVYNDEIYIKMRNGERFPAEYWSYAIANKSEIIGSVVTFLDISRRKRDESLRSIIYEIAKHSASSTSPGELINLVRRELGKVMDTSHLYIALYNYESDMIRVVDHDPRITSKRSWKAESSLAGYVVENRKSLLLSGQGVTDFVTENGIRLWRRPAACWLGVPLLDDGGPVGVLVVKSYTDPAAYDSGSVHLLELVAHELTGVLVKQKMINDLIVAKNRAEESDRLKSLFLANISHEIRTPMNGILGFVDLLGADEISEEERKRYVEIVKKSSMRLLGTINDIVEISKIESGQTDVIYNDVNVVEVMEYYGNLYKGQAERKNIRFVMGEYLGMPGSQHEEKTRLDGKSRLDVSEHLPIIRTDRNKLDGILNNLLSNALKFTETGEIELGNYVDGDLLVFYIKDTGIGIPADKLESIFERFVQVDTNIASPYEGSGLGLSISRAYVNALGGKIWVSSQIGKGSSFYFAIPMNN